MSARWLAPLLALAVLALACTRSDNEEVDVTVDGTPVPPPTSTTPAPTATPRETVRLVKAPIETPEPDTLDPDNLSGFTHPVEGACLPFTDLLMPNAPRAYRNGVHEGVDIYPGYACAYVEEGTPILAVYDGKVIRAEVPLAEMFGYATDLRSMSQGRAVYSMEFQKYSEVPQNVADTVLKKAS